MSNLQLHFQDYVKQGSVTGEVISIEGEMVTATGLAGATLQELIVFDSETEAFVFGIKGQTAELVLLGNKEVTIGSKAVRTGQQLSFPCSSELLGRVVSPLGIDALTHHRIHSHDMRPVDIKAVGIDQRLKITEQLETGVMLVDMLLPLGKGQRELLIGDRKTGKTQFALDTLLHQIKQDTICIYVAIGKSQTTIRKIADYINHNDASKKTVIIASPADDPAGLMYLSAFAGMTLAEYFKDQGHNVLLILDDLTTHARSYRELSLLARRFPGRNAYPGDIFYLHARLLERAGNFKHKNGAVSLTCLPIAETQQADLTGFVQTNLMSMTDGHLYFDIDRFLDGYRPAIHPFLSVTRVGRQTKTPLLRESISEITSFLSRAERLNQIKHFGQELSDDAQATLAKAEKYMLLFGMAEVGTWPQWFQFFLVALVWKGYWITSGDDTANTDISKLYTLASKHSEIATQIQGLLTSASLTLAGEKAKDIADHIFSQYP